MSDGQSGGWERICGGKDFWKGCALSLEWKIMGVMDGEGGSDGAGRTRLVE